MQRNRLSKNNKGVTLVEVIAVIAVLGVVMAAVTGFMITGAKMSAKVSNQAKLDIRQQTAVEFINERLWEAETIGFITENGENIGITIDGRELKTSNEDTEKPVVIYNEVELCEGTIYFSAISNNIITYYLNDTVHVVHFRVEIDDSP